MFPSVRSRCPSAEILRLERVNSGFVQHDHVGFGFAISDFEQKPEEESFRARNVSKRFINEAFSAPPLAVRESSSKTSYKNAALPRNRLRCRNALWKFSCALLTTQSTSFASEDPEAKMENQAKQNFSEGGPEHSMNAL